MIAGFVALTRRTIADRPQPTVNHRAKLAVSLRDATGPGYQVGLTERVLRQASRP